MAQRPIKLFANDPFQYEKAFSRNLGLVSEAEQEKLRNATIAIPGMGGVGGMHLITLARMGVGGFHVADADTFELANFNRQYGATVSTLGLEKTDVMVERVRDINPRARIHAWHEPIGAANIDSFLQGCDVVIDSVDAFALEERRLIFKRAQEMGIPVITAGPFGFACAMLAFTKDSMSFDRYFNYVEGAPSLKNFASFVIGVAPRPYFLSYMQKNKVKTESRTGPSIASAIDLCAGMAATEALKHILGRGKRHAVPHYTYLDPYLMKFKHGYIPFGNKNPLQRILHFFLHRELKRRAGQ